MSGLTDDIGSSRLAEALLLADPEDQASLDAVRELVEELLPRLCDEHAIVEQPIRVCVALLEAGTSSHARDALERLTAALAPVLAAPEFEAHVSASGAGSPSAGGLATATASDATTPADTPAPAGEHIPAPAGENQAAGVREPPSPAPPAASLADDPELVCEFIDSARERLDEADACLLTLEQDHADKEAVDEVFRAFHTIKGMAGFLALQGIEQTAHDAENTLDGVRKGTLDLDRGVMDALFAAVDVLRGLLGEIFRPGAGGAPTPVGNEAPAGIDEPPEAPGPLADVEAASAPTASRPAAPRTAGGTAPATKARGTVHVDEERLDRLLEAIGELVIAEAGLNQSLQARGGIDQSLVVQLGRLDKIGRQLQEMATSIRMVTLRTTLRRMARLVRDLAHESGRPVRCVLEGEEIELDKHVVEGITDSLVHLVRNAVDHGVESDPEQRVRAGKPRTATVRISASHAGGRIVIDVEDDGRGIDTASVLARARELGIVGRDDTPAPEDLTHLLFTPGFSTKETVTGVSGRGVGMDVVKRTAETLLGTVALATTPGHGTTVRLTLPLTLAIIDGMLVRVGDERYIIPALAIVRSQRIGPGDVTDVLGQTEMLTTPEGVVPLIRLRRLFGMNGSREADGGDDLVTIVSAADGSSLAGLVVSELLGQHQIVMKALGAGLGDIRGVSGAAILADGGVGLVIDVQQTVRLAHGGKE